MTFVLIVAGLDLSVAQNMYLSAVLIAIAMDTMRKAGTLGTVWSFVIIFGIALATGAIIGTFKWGINSPLENRTISCDPRYARDRAGWR